MKKIMTLTTTIALLFVMTVSLAGCGAEESTTSPSVSLVDVTTDQGISMKLPSDMTKQDNGAYVNMKTGDTVNCGVGETAGKLLSDWKEENVSATYASKYEDIVIKSFENGKRINGKEALQSTLTLKTPKGNALTTTLVIVTDGTNNNIISLSYGSANTDGALAQNLQACIDSITIK